MNPFYLSFNVDKNHIFLICYKITISSKIKRKKFLLIFFGNNSILLDDYKLNILSFSFTEQNNSLHF